MVVCWIHLTVLASIALLISGDESAEPRVAFLCGRPAMYSTEHGMSWVKDDNTDCLKDPTDILNYCKKIYPTLDIRNVVESTEKVTISDWCDAGVYVCNKQFTVQPFRCLVGAFQSDALLVPENCAFDHIHDSKLCTTFSEWNKSSIQACVDRGMIQQTFAMLQPCGIDRFNGVEFVCCPTKQANTDRRIIVTSGGKKQQQQAEVQKLAKLQQLPSATVDKSAGSSEEEDSSEVGRYIHHDEERGEKWNEHERFIKAKDNLQKLHHDKIGKMMNDWAAARERIQTLRATNPKESEKLNKEITSRFQKMYEAEEELSTNEKKQLKQLHQQRVEAGIMKNKEQAFDEYLNAMNDPRADVIEILRTLKRYIKTLHKDRMHTINHYEHVEDTDPEEADSIHQEIADHLRRVDQQLSDAVEMLNRVSSLKSKILKQIQIFLDAYHSMDSDVNRILRTASAHQDTKKQEKSITELKDKTDDDDDGDKRDNSDEDEEIYDDEVMEDERTYEIAAANKKPAVIETTRAPTTTKSTEGGDGLGVEMKEGAGNNVEVAVDYHHLPGFNNDHHDDAANIDKDVMAVDQAYIWKSHGDLSSSSSHAMLAVIICSTLAITALVVAGVVVVFRRRRRHAYRRPLRMNLDPTVDMDDVTPEERHVTSMQMNGYENPTYKFFEQHNNVRA